MQQRRVGNLGSTQVQPRQAFPALDGGKARVGDQLVVTQVEISNARDMPLQLPEAVIADTR